MAIKAGDRMPAGKLKTMTKDGPKDVTTDELFKGKKVVLFSVPGAFTPTCDAKHLPGFVEKAGDLRQKGVQEVACVSVNDAFVMGAWGKDQACAGKVRMLADGNGELAKAIGLELDASGFGMGKRSKRYAIIANDGKVEQVLVDESGLKESSAESVLSKL